jgi:DNA-binding IclR family transcriptional regulator
MGDEQILERIRGEFLEMPGLALTSPQARRLLGLDEQRCHRLLDRLVEIRFLRRTGTGQYARLTDGAGPSPLDARTRVRPTIDERSLV